MDSTKLVERVYIGSAPTGSHGFNVIALCAEEYQPPAKVFAPAKVLRIRLADNFRPLSAPRVREIKDKVSFLVEEWAEGSSLLITCAMGRNRSALISALVLSQVCNVSPAEAGKYVRKVRKDAYGVAALENAYFREVLRRWEA
jgi:protein-tyrosine phosphatase